MFKNEPVQLLVNKITNTMEALTSKEASFLLAYLTCLAQLIIVAPEIKLSKYDMAEFCYWVYS